jgi:hypothetical protein
MVAAAASSNSSSRAPQPSFIIPSLVEPLIQIGRARDPTIASHLPSLYVSATPKPLLQPSTAHLSTLYPETSGCSSLHLGSKHGTGQDITERINRCRSKGMGLQALHSHPPSPPPPPPLPLLPTTTNYLPLPLSLQLLLPLPVRMRVHSSQQSRLSPLNLSYRRRTESGPLLDVVIL